MPEAPAASPITIPAPAGNHCRERGIHGLAPWPVLGLVDVADAAADGDLTRMAARRVAQLVHPLEEMRGGLPLEMVGLFHQRITFTPERGGRVRIRVGGDELQIEDMAELRAYSNVLSAFVVAFDAYDPMAEFHEEAEALVEAEAKRRGRRRSPAA